MKKGFTLVTLILTVLVMSVLATALILQVDNDDLIDETKEVKFREDLYRLNEQVEVGMDNLIMDRGSEFDKENFKLSENELKDFVETIPEAFLEETTKNNIYAKVENGRLVLNSKFRNDFKDKKIFTQIEQWCNEIGVIILN